MAKDSRTKFLDGEMRPLSAASEVETVPEQSSSPQTRRAGKKVCRNLPLRTSVERVLAFLAIALFVVCVVVIALLAVAEKNVQENRERDTIVKTCSFSEEAMRVDLEGFLKKVQETYYEYNSLEYIPGPNVPAARYRPQTNFTPAYLKEKADAALSLLAEVQSMDINELKLKPREAKAFYELKQFLRTTFASPYDTNFYNGDWMMGINNFCLNPVCNLGRQLMKFSEWVWPKNLDDLKHILSIIYEHGKAIKQYRSNMQLGVKTGMVRSVETCKAGLNAFKSRYKEATKDENPENILEEMFARGFRHESYIQDLSLEARTQWLETKGKTVSASIDEALVEGFGRPLTDFVRYLEFSHIRHCLPKDLSSGLSGLPVDFIYIDGNETIIPTTKVLPITGLKLSGRESYTNILRHFTTSGITPDEIHKIGRKTLSDLYPQAIAIARNITAETDDDTAIREFKKLLRKQERFFNDAPFPANESGVAAFKNCSDIASARLNCPTRWEAMLKWMDYSRQVLGMFAPKLISMFYHTGPKISIPNCPVEMKPDFNPASGTQSYTVSNAGCETPAYISFPFFLNNYGPKHSDWTAAAHEGWPGHHTQLQGAAEYFEDHCQDVLKWLNRISAYSFYVEGWGLYAEKPAIADDTDTYEGHPLEKYGMLKWQIWRSLRLIVDTGLHYRGMNRSEALGLFSKYAWDDSDLSEKEVTRYQAVAGQATSYTLGQHKIIEMRKYCERELGDKFDIREFHYQILSLGSVTEEYMDRNMKNYVKCIAEDIDDDFCYYILHPMQKSNMYDSEEDWRLSRQFPRQYYL